MNSEAVMNLRPAGNEQYGGDELHADGGKVMGMKFSFSTLGCPDWTLEEILDFAAGNDLGVEIRGIGPNVNTADITELKPENIDETRAMIGEYGVKIVGLGTSAFFDGHMPFPDALREVDAAAVIAERLGVSMLRIFGDQIWDERISADILRIAGDGKVHGLFRCAVDYCKLLSPDVRIDTHADNHVMQRRIAENGFTKCGIIYVEDGSPRLAYHWTA